MSEDWIAARARSLASAIIRDEQGIAEAKDACISFGREVAERVLRETREESAVEIARLQDAVEWAKILRGLREP